MSNGPQVQGEISLDTKSLDDALKKLRDFEGQIARVNKSVTDQVNKINSSVDSLASSVNTQTSATTRAVKATDSLTRAQQQQNLANEQGLGASAASIRAVNQLEVSYDKLSNRVKASALEETTKATSTQRLNQLLNTARTSIDTYGARSVQAAKAVAALRKESNLVGIAVNNANRSFRGQEIEGFKNQMREMSASVSLALGPLSGISARIITFNGIINRTGLSIAAMVGSFVAFTTSLRSAFTAAREAETSFLRIDAIVKSMGATAKLTGQEIFDMGHSIAAATLTSAAEARNAALALSNFSTVAADQFERVIITAQGMSEQFGGDLVSNVRVLGRVMQDPIGRLNDLERRMGRFDDSVRKQIQSFVAVGDRVGANNVLLQALSGQYDIATASAGGLAGVLDTISGNFDKFYEKTMLASGGIEEATHQANRLNDTFEKILDQNAVDALGNAYVMTIRLIGNTINTLVANIDVLGTALTLMAGVTISKLFVGATLLAVRGVSAFRTALIAKTATIALADKAARGLVGTMMALNPALRVVYLAALVAGPVLATLGARFIFSGKAADESEVNLAKYAKTLEGMVKDARQLVTFNRELEETIRQADGLAQGMSYLQRSIDDTQRSFRSIGQQVERTVAFRGFRGDVDSVVDALIRLETEGSDAITNFDDLANIEYFNQLQKEGNSVVGLIDRLKNLRLNLNQLSESQRETARSINNTTVAVDDQNKAARESLALWEQQIEAVDSLRSTFDSDVYQLEKLKETEMQMQAILKTLQDNALADGWESAGEQIEIVTRMLDNLRKQMNELQDDKGEKLGTGFLALQRDLAKVRLEANSLVAIFQGADAGELKLLNDITNTTMLASDNIRRLNETELTALAKNLEGIEGRAAGEELADYAERVAQAYSHAVAEQMRSIDLSQRQIEAQDLLNDKFNQSKSQITLLREEYDQLADAAMLTGGDAETLGQLATMLAAEEEMMRAHAEKMAQFSILTASSEIEALRQTRAEELAQMYADDEAAYKEHLDRMNAAADRAKIYSATIEGAEATANALSGIMAGMQAQNRQDTRAYQTIARAQAVIAGGLAASKAIAAAAGNPVLAALNVAAIGFQTGAQLAAIDNAFAEGGHVQGKGTGTSDSIPAMLSAGEYVIKASAVRQLGLDNLEQLNQGKMPVYATGGGVAPVVSKNASQNVSAGVSVTIVNQGSPMEVERTEESISPDGSMQLKMFVKSIVREEMNTGALDQANARNYGLTRRPKQR